MARREGEDLRAIFFHGLGGSGSEWDGLQERVPAFAPDLQPGDNPRSVIHEPPIALIGHSLGGHQAFRIAAAEPSLVARLVVIEASPERNPQAPQDVRAFFTEHPAPYGVAVDPDAAAAAVADLARRNWWAVWSSIRCPVLVVRAENGHVPRNIAERMVAALADARLVEIARAGHDVHLDDPDGLANVLAEFLESGGLG